MDGDELYYDDLVEGIAADELFALVDDAYAATQRQAADTIPRAVPPPQHVLPRQYNAHALGDKPDLKPVLQPPARLLRQPVSFGDTDAQTLDAGVLDDGGGPSLVDEQSARHRNGGNTAHILAHGQTGEQTRRFLQADVSSENYTGAIDASRGHGVNKAPDLEAHERPSMPDEALGNDYSEVINAGDLQQMDVEDMLDQIEQLTRERERLHQELNSAKIDADTRAGEIAIIRANQAKLEQNHNRQLSALRSALDEELKKHQAEVDAAVMESKRLVTENQFLKQDLREEALRLNEIQQARKAKAQTEAAPTTPSKARMIPLRDGFDDDEIMASPTKSAGRRSKRGTPTVPGKRKRSVTDSGPPIPALQLSQSFESNLLDADELLDPIQPSIRAGKNAKEDINTGFIRKILNHKTYPRKIRDLEVFASLSFPSDPGTMFSSYILKATTTKPSQNYPVEYGQAVISLWSRALKEKFYEPVSMFVSIIRFILNLDFTGIAPLLVEDLVDVLQGTAYVNGIPRFTSSPVSHLSFGQVKQTPRKELSLQVNGTEALELLYLLASGCSHDEHVLRRFWSAVRYDFILIMLNPYQPIKDIIIVLNLLSCSILPTTFGPILKTETEQIANEKYLIDRAANLLHEQPSVDEGERPCTAWEVATLRMEAMSFLLEIAFSCPSSDPQQNTAGRLIATHQTALARIFRAMHDELAALYSYPPERDLHAAIINGLTRIAYGIMTTFSDIVDLPDKLRSVPGAVQKHLVVLTRLAFSEGPLLEAGITDDTVEMAHELLEDAVNPQEAESLSEAFRSSSKRNERDIS